MRRGNAFELLDDPAAARDAYRRAAEGDPRSFEAQFNYGTSLLASGDPKGAFEHLRRALDLNPDYVDAWLQLAKAHADGGTRPRRRGSSIGRGRTSATSRRSCSRDPTCCSGRATSTGRSGASASSCGTSPTTRARPSASPTSGSAWRSGSSPPAGAGGT